MSYSPPSSPSRDSCSSGGFSPLPVQPIMASVVCRDLSLPLEMRHPLTMLRLLQFVDSYNEYAPAGERINYPSIPTFIINDVLTHADMDGLTEKQRDTLDILFSKYRCDFSESEADYYRRHNISHDGDGNAVMSNLTSTAAVVDESSAAVVGESSAVVVGESSAAVVGESSAAVVSDSSAAAVGESSTQ